MIMLIMTIFTQSGMHLYQRPSDVFHTINLILPRASIHHIHGRRFMSWQRIVLHIWANITEGEHSRMDQSLDFILQGPTIFQIMPRSILMKSTSGISLVPPREFLWNRGW